MWLSRQAMRPRKEIYSGRISTMERAAAYTSGQQKITLLSPAGFSGTGENGMELVLIRDGQGRRYAIPVDPGKAGSGETMIYAGKSRIVLKKDGTVRISGQVEIEGGLKVNGAEIG